MTETRIINTDPEPWVCTDENGNPYRTRFAHEDGIDANGVEWSGWTFAPRREYNSTVISPSFRDPEPWVSTDPENGRLIRARFAHEDGADYRGIIWEGWTHSPRTEDEYKADMIFEADEV